MSAYDMYYDRQGNKITADQYYAIVESDDSRDYKRVASDEINGLWVSTVWLGLNHSWNGGPPLIFETMVFPADSMAEIACDRYSTEEEALKGHDKLVEWAKKYTTKHEEKS